MLAPFLLGDAISPFTFAISPLTFAISPSLSPQKKGVGEGL